MHFRTDLGGSGNPFGFMIKQWLSRIMALPCHFSWVSTLTLSWTLVFECSTISCNYTLSHGKLHTRSLNNIVRSNLTSLPRHPFGSELSREIIQRYLRFAPLDRYPSNFHFIVSDLLAWVKATLLSPTGHLSPL